MRTDGDIAVRSEMYSSLPVTQQLHIYFLFTSMVCMVLVLAGEVISTL